MGKTYDVPVMNITMFDDSIRTGEGDSISGYTAGQHVEGQLMKINSHRTGVYTVRFQEVLEFKE